MDKKILVVNPGSTSTKIAVFENTKPVFAKKITHEIEELKNKLSKMIGIPAWLSIDADKLTKIDIPENF